MTQKIKLEEKEYEIETLSDKAKATVNALQFTDSRILEMQNILALMQRAKKSYIESIKKEMIAEKAGFLLED